MGARPGSPLTDAGRALGHAGLCVDVDDARRERGRHALLAEVTAALDPAVDTEQRMQALVALLVERVGDAALVQVARRHRRNCGRWPRGRASPARRPR